MESMDKGVDSANDHTHKVESNQIEEDKKIDQDEEFPNGIADDEDYSWLPEELLDYIKDLELEVGSLNVQLGEGNVEEAVASRYEGIPILGAIFKYFSSSVKEYPIPQAKAKVSSRAPSKSYILSNDDNHQQAPIMLKNKLYKKSDLHLKTQCFKCLQDLSEPIDINEAIKDLLYIYEEYINPPEKEISEHIKNCHQQYLDKKVTSTECITMIWTYGSTFTKIINCAMVTDSVYTYGLKKLQFSFYVKTLKDLNLDYK